MALCVAGSVDHITNDTYTSPNVFNLHSPRSHIFSYFSCLLLCDVDVQSSTVKGNSNLFSFVSTNFMYSLFFCFVAALFCRSIRFWFVSLAVSCVPYALRPFLRHFLHSLHYSPMGMRWGAVENVGTEYARKYSPFPTEQRNRKYEKKNI